MSFNRVGKNKYVFPFNLIEEIVVLERAQITYSEQKHQAIFFHRGIHIPVIFCAHLFREGEHERNDGFLSIIVSLDQFKYCLVVDEILGKQEIVVKTLGDLLSEYVYFSGGTIFGDGTIGFVVDMQGLVEVASGMVS